MTGVEGPGGASVAAPDYVVVLTTLPAEGAADFAASLVEHRVAACVNVFPEMQSVYRWEGGIEQERERQVLIKTTRDRVEALWERVRDRHPYDVPEFLVIPVIDGSESYLRWVRESTATPPASF